MMRYDETKSFLNLAVSCHLQVAGRYNSDKKFENGGHFFYDGKFERVLFSLQLYIIPMQIFNLNKFI